MAEQDESPEPFKVPRIVQETSEPPEGAANVYADGIHSRMRVGNMTKISFYQDLPGIKPRIEDGKAAMLPQRRVVAYLTMDAVSFAQTVFRLKIW
jgi:hypothetical protein